MGYFVIFNYAVCFRDEIGYLCANQLLIIYKNTKTMKMKRLTLVLGVLFMGGVLAASMTSCGNSGDKAAPATEATVDEAAPANDEGAAVEESTDTTAKEAAEEMKCGAGKCGGAEAAEAAPADEAAATEADVEAAPEKEAPAAEKAPEAPAETEKCGK